MPEQRLATEPEAIFVVGVARSGTTLMRNILERSDRIAIADENFYLGHLFGRPGVRDRIRRAGDLATDATMRRIVEMIYPSSGRNASEWHESGHFWPWLVANVPVDEMEQRLLAAERTERGVMTAFLRAYADELGRPIMGEKTPAHLAHVDTLLDWFPSARVVHVVRDPRGIYVSDIRRRMGKPRGFYGRLTRIPAVLRAVLLVHVTVVWLGAARRHAAYRKRYSGRYMAVRFEDIVSDSARALPPLFEFLGVELPSNATEVEVVARGYRAGTAGLDAGAADRWREQIGRLAESWLWFFCGRSMRRLGYSRHAGAAPTTAAAN